MESYKDHLISVSAKQKPNGRWYSIFKFEDKKNQAMQGEEAWDPDFSTENEAIENGRIRAMEGVDQQ